MFAFFSTRGVLMLKPAPYSLPLMMLPPSPPPPPPLRNCVVPLLRENQDDENGTESWFSRLINQRNRSMMGPIYMPIIAGHEGRIIDENGGVVDVLYRAWFLEKYSKFPPYQLFFMSRSREA